MHCYKQQQQRANRGAGIIGIFHTIFKAQLQNIQIIKHTIVSVQGISPRSAGEFQFPARTQLLFDMTSTKYG